MNKYQLQNQITQEITNELKKLTHPYTIKPFNHPHTPEITIIHPLATNQTPTYIDYLITLNQTTIQATTKTTHYQNGTKTQTITQELENPNCFKNTAQQILTQTQQIMPCSPKNSKTA